MSVRPSRRRSMSGMLRCPRVHSPSGLTRRSLLHGAAAASVASVVPVSLAAQPRDPVGEAVARSGVAFLDALDARQRRAASFPFGDTERQNWHYVPRSRKGVPLKEMAAPARAATHDLLRAALSANGYA